ncbi:RNA polymerase sporulation sigma factor SigH [Ihubacter sp. mB4P-1]|uniref:RNA polymerase sporulation sigma factor SigH n=1 Tax=Ihubacter sp. mB4P-1 TaxID=3242370 RepID=UPI00137B0303
MVDRDLNVLTDESIVKMAQEGSSTAYEYLIDKYKGLARSKAATYFIVGADKDDVIQEGMIGIFKAVRDFDQEGEASFRTFVELCVNRQIISAIKGANRQKHQILNKSVSLSARPENENDETPALAERLAANSADTDPEVMMLMREVIEFLKANEQNLFSPLENQVWEQMLKGRGYREIAFRLRRSTKTVDNAMQRIKKKVEMYLES